MHHICMANCAMSKFPIKAEKRPLFINLDYKKILAFVALSLTYWLQISNVHLFLILLIISHEISATCIFFQGRIELQDWNEN